LQIPRPAALACGCKAIVFCWLGDCLSKAAKTTAKQKLAKRLSAFDGLKAEQSIEKIAHL
jgi:ABC-type branched-subunit amino acid transport system substrate-binding protein